MCLGEIGQVRDVVAGVSAVVRSGERTADVSLVTLDDPVSPGDWVVYHSGFALSRLDAAEAEEAVRLRAGRPDG